MKVEKGYSGYLKSKRNRLLIQTVVSFGLVAAVFILGWVQTGTRLNLLTLVAVLGCLPACKVLVGLITISPYKGIEEKKAYETDRKAPLLTNIYDLVITSREHIMPVDAIAISGHTVCGYAPNKKTNTDEVAKHIRNILEENRISKVTVKIFPDYVSFLSRAEGMNSIAQIEGNGQKRVEQKIRQIILNISM